MAEIRNADEATYKRRINAWAMYDWANSAFATTILASLLPIYYSTVAGSQSSQRSYRYRLLVA